MITECALCYCPREVLGDFYEVVAWVRLPLPATLFALSTGHMATNYP